MNGERWGNEQMKSGVTQEPENQQKWTETRITKIKQEITQTKSHGDQTKTRT